MQSTSSSSPSAVAQSTQHRSQSPQEQHFVSEGEQTTTINNLRTHINGEKKRLNAILKSVRSVEDAQQQVNETVEERSNQLRLLREQNDELTHVVSVSWYSLVPATQAMALAAGGCLTLR
eukprot:gb/GECG01006984.1/.p1 GENE.gb/GECG01006984.1/~~gb/GECG01006984.1/.p1  ORF type:complete len:120 (+),score=22.15 gb/GECG01006984.1/:1-360(+)